MSIIIKEIVSKNIITKSKLPDTDYVINNYVGCNHGCIYCYAEFMKRFTNHTEKWGEFLDVKKFNEEKFVKYLKKINSDKKILMSSVTDPYNPYEIKYKSTRNILKLFIQANNEHIHLEILTKSLLIFRDIDLLKKIKNITVGISLNTLNDNLRRQIEPCAGSIKSRIEILKKLKGENIPVYLFISPIFPMLTQLEEIIATCKDTVDFIYFENLNLRGRYKKIILDFISKNFPEYNQLYQDIYTKNKKEYWYLLMEDINRLCKIYDIKYKTFFFHDNKSS
ncbi:radical SAM protein [Leptotrichia sp. oral taxon 223]|uniref:radical SAM protein n=1 Tax=Leptotrichia sp. oral taxon 223 TaxID=712363 RepID=UPI0015B9937B|nr:radical SAM protein [Leptotrichia sp. oral taxon 223]NWO18399.1 radical SAM protein [Leptotrichia sp. oral taxon 223]